MTDKFICNMCGAGLIKIRVDEKNPILKKTYTHALVCLNFRCKAHNLNQVYVEEKLTKVNDITSLEKCDALLAESLDSVREDIINLEDKVDDLFGEIKNTNAHVSVLSEGLDSNDGNIKDLYIRHEHLKEKIQELNLKYWHRLTLLEDYVFISDENLEKKAIELRGEDPRKKI